MLMTAVRTEGAEAPESPPPPEPGDGHEVASGHRLFSRLSRLSFTAGAETIGVAVGAISGFAIVHELPKAVYAQYSFIVVCVTFLIGLSDVGLSHCYLPLIGNRTHPLSWVIGACRRVYQLRWLFFLPALVFVLCYWIYASVQHAWLFGDFIAASLIGAVAVLVTIREQASRSLLIVLRHVSIVNRMTLASSAARLGFVLAALLLLPAAYVVIGLMLATALGSMVALAQLVAVPEVKAFGKATLEKTQRADVDQRVKAILQPLVIPMIFYQVQGVIAVFLVSLFGVTNSIAEVGALTRPTLILAVLDRVMNVLLFPGIARAASGAPLHRLIVRSQLLYFSLVLLLLLSSIVWPELWILLIGRQYLPQKDLLWMVFLSAILMYAAGTAFATLTSRGKTSGQFLLIPLVLAIQLALVIFMGVSTTRQALVFSIATSTTFFVFQYAMLARQYLTYREAKSRA